MKKILWLDNRVPTAADWRLVGQGGMNVRHACHYIMSSGGVWYAVGKGNPSYESDLACARKDFTRLIEWGYEQVYHSNPFTKKIGGI